MPYTPDNGADVHWFLMDGTGHVVTKFTNNGIPKQITVDWLKARYGDPTKSSNQPFTQYRFGLDPLKGILPGAINVASQDPKSGITVPTDQMTAYVQAYDIAATLCEKGENSPFVLKYKVAGEVGDWPVREGDSTNPSNRTARKIRGPYGNFEKTVGGVTYYYKNTRPNQPGDPWYISATESKPWDGNKVIVSPTTTTQPTMPNAPTTAPVVDSPTAPDVKTQISLIVANYSRDLPPEGEGGRYANRLRQMIKELKGLVS